MKKNLLSVLILALLIVNITLTSIMMISVISTNGKTGELVTSIATVMNLELYGPNVDNANSVPLSQTATYTIADTLKIQLSHDTDEAGNPVGADMVVFEMSLAMDMENEGYEKYGSVESMTNFEVQIKDAVESVVKQYTEAECRDSATFEQIRMEILLALQQLFQSDFIYRVSISNMVFA